MSEPDPSGSFPPGPPPSALSAARLVSLLALALFALAAWPLLLVDLPPLQDLPNHVATAHIIAHPDLYPQYTFNGLFKSNALLTLWFYVLGGHGLFGAARLFVALVLAVNAVGLPIFILHFAGRRHLLAAMLLVWPLVHSYSVAMGFLNFAFSFGLSLILLTVIDRQRQRPTIARGGGIALLACVVAYAHPFPLMLVGGLVGLHAVTRTNWPSRVAAAVALGAPLAPAALLSLVTAQQHLVKAEHSTAAAATARTLFHFTNPWESVAHLWLDVSGAFTRWGSMTIVPALLLAFFAWRHRNVERPFLSKAAMAVLAVAFVGLPMMLSNWWHLNCRLVPFLWAGLALRLPPRLPRPLVPVLAACALSFSAVTGIDYVRLDRDRAAFTAGIDAVPERATLLPLMFKQTRTAEFTSSLTHAWGYYAVAKSTSAPLVFAVERSYPITYRDFPPPALIPPVFDRFAQWNATPARVCGLLQQPPDRPACTAIWREVWTGFWRDAEPRFSHLLVWAMPPETRSVIPAAYRRVFAAGDLEIYAREAAPAARSR
jgi:hypothetical protein